MRSMMLAAGLAMIGAISASSAWAAPTCSARNQQCIQYCDGINKGGKGYGCHSGCADAMSECMKSGCYNTRMRSACGFSRS